MPGSSESAGGLEIRVFGELTVLCGGRVSALPASRKTKALLGYLVATGVPQAREHLCDLLWDGPSDPRAELRWCLSKLRPMLEIDGERRIAADREHAGFEPNGAVVDLTALEALVEGQLCDVALESLVQATQLVRGDFLAGLDMPDCRRFQLWMMSQRERHKIRHLEILEELVRRLHQKPAEALPYARAFVAIDSESETGHVLIMELLGALGRKREALEHYKVYRRMLEGEFGVRPSPRIEQARMVLGANRQPAAADDAASPDQSRTDAQTSNARWPPLVGRQAELAEIARAVDRTLSGAGQHLLVLRGQPGIGKTRLLENVVRQMRTAGGMTLWGRGFEAEMTRPYGAWVDAVRGLAPGLDLAVRFPDLTILLPELGPPAAGVADRNRLFDAVLGLLTHLTESSPLAVALDDVHWLDEGSAALLHYVARRLRGRRVLLACAARPGELISNAPAWQVLRALAREAGTQTLTVGPLDEKTTAELVRTVASGVDPDRVFIESQGNSLFALEVARALAERGTCLSDSLEGVIADRLAGLDETARSLVAWAACLSGRIRLEVLVAVSGCPATDVLHAIEDLERRAILRVTDGDAYDFEHDLIRHVAYAQIAEPRRRLCHAEIARVQSELGSRDVALAVEIAHHADLGALHRLAAQSAVTAGEQCLAVFANTEALAVARRGLAHLEHLDPEDRVGLRVSLLAVAAEAGLSNWRSRMPDVASEMERAVQDAHQAGDYGAAARGRFVLSMLHERDAGRAHRETLLAAENARAATPATAARQLGNTGQCLALIQRDIGRARTLLNEAQRLARELGLEIGNIEAGLGIVALWDGDSELAREYLGRGLELLRKERDRYHECKCLMYLARLELERDRPRQALVHCTELMPVASGMGEGSEAPTAAVLEALAHVALGSPEGDQRLSGALHALNEIDAQGSLAYALNVAALLDIRAGRLEAARGRAEQALHAAERVGRKTEVAFARTLLARVALTEGHRRAARAHLESVLPDVIDRDAFDARTQKAVRTLARQLEIVVPAADLLES